MELLSFDSLAETDVVRLFPASAKVFLFASAGIRTRNLPYGNRTLYLLSHQGSLSLSLSLPLYRRRPVIKRKSPELSLSDFPQTMHKFYPTQDLVYPALQST